MDPCGVFQITELQLTNLILGLKKAFIYVTLRNVTRRGHSVLVTDIRNEDNTLYFSMFRG